MMMRIRRRFALLLCGVCVALFLTLYIIINYAVPAEDLQPNIGAMQSKLQQLENGIRRHDKVMRSLENRLENSFKQQWKVGKEYDAKVHDVNGATFLEKSKYQQLHVQPEPHNKDNNNVDEQCNFDLQQISQPDVQMFDMYDKMSFADVDGGVWKQGWNIKYDSMRFNDHNKLRVFVVPHSHNDPGWLKTFDEYYEQSTQHILSNALRHLSENPEMRFIWAEISYFSRFYEDLGEKNRNQIKKLVQNRQLEFVTGGWVMPDEANSHWMSVLLQLTEGQTWLQQYLNVTPQSSWSIDPFGHSPTLPYILQKSGFRNLLIQRTHYSVKKELALKRQLEFHWRQLWDDIGETDLFTHMMPFYSYDIPHTCGPDPKICCQFDFKRLPGFGLTCPWRAAPKPITSQNVAERAEVLVDQWKKKAELYRSYAVLIPLGDDFRYSQSTEWTAQRINFQTLFDHINEERQYNVEAKFATLQEYFDAVHAQTKYKFPTLSGDFFTYADRSDNYWSGYYTSRPYHKRMDRVLLHYVRSAELLKSWHSWQPSMKLDEMLSDARRQLALFQHHDGITGTAKTHVVEDYARRMLDAIRACKFVMQQAVYRLMTKPSIYNADEKFNYFYVDDSQWPSPDDSRPPIILGEELPSKHVVVHNSLPQWREELVDFYVSSPFVSVVDFDNTPVAAQVNPVWTWHRHTPTNTITPQAATTKYRLIFKAKVPPLGLTTYIINLETSDTKPPYTTYATNVLLTTTPTSVNLGQYPDDVKFVEHRELTLHVPGGPTVAFSADGLMKSIQLNKSLPHTPLHLKFLKYGTRSNGDSSGAYLFLPNGPATAFVTNQAPPVVLVSEGQLESSIATGLPFVVHQTVLRADQMPEIRNLVDIKEFDNTEIVMRFSTHIHNDDLFYTDLNGLQIIKRKRLSKLPLQGNYYPVPSAIYIEDEELRLSVLSAQPLGGSSLAAGELELMQDRRLSKDDERGLGQGVVDNQPVVHIYRLVLEQLDKCARIPEQQPQGALTAAAYQNSKKLLHPLDKFIYSENDWLGVQRGFGHQHVALANDYEVVTMRSLLSLSVSQPNVRNRKAHESHVTGIILHRTTLLQCPSSNNKNQTPPENSDMAPLLNLLHLNASQVTELYRTTLTFLQRLQQHQLSQGNMLQLCPMDTKAFTIYYNNNLK